ncbi:acyltransferase family protein [Roseomonas haemaphysalidis]|uniref:acyltransferase family protein n=1 Tax=Roseomonas haemaphysalidis TaxID=2768162 RepID=UPI0023512A4B|nr:acyltransferase [Roseomonas haemaphysalidis]
MGVKVGSRSTVSVFFVLSGFVMAAAADRCRGSLLMNSVARYLRLAVPVTASCLLAWGWLTAFPDSASALKAALPAPSRWLDYTYQGTIHPIWHAAADGLLGNFLRGDSAFNNVLWTMQIELFGSLGIFVLYALTKGPTRLWSLLAAGVAILLWLPDTYIGFVFGAGLYEAHRRGLLRTSRILLPIASFIVALVVGGMGDGAHERLGLPGVPEALELGEPRGFVNGVAAALLIYATLTLPWLARGLSRSVPLSLGRISFGLYLVHVPPLYTIVAWSYLQGVPEAVLAPLYLVGMLILAWVFTHAVDEPSLRWIAALRSRIGQPRVQLRT